MKRLISIAVVLTVLTLSLAGCAEAFDLDKSIEALKAKGLVSQGVLTTEDELDEINRMMSSMIEIMGGDFTVTVTAYQSLIQDNDRTKCVEFITFKTQDDSISTILKLFQQFDSQFHFLTTSKERDCIKSNGSLSHL